MTNQLKSSSGAKLLKELGDILGIFYKEKKDTLVDPEIRILIDKRDQARKNKNWAEADKIKIELTQKGWQVKDTPQGTKIEKL